MNMRKERHKNDPHPDQIQRAEDIKTVWKLKRDGNSFDAVAEIMGKSATTCRKLFKEGLLLQAPPGAEEERVLAVQQLDVLYHNAIQLLKDADTNEAVKILTLADRLLKSRRELLGLDAAQKYSITTRNQSDLEIADLIEEMERQDDELRQRIADGEAPQYRTRARP